MKQLAITIVKHYGDYDLEPNVFCFVEINQSSDEYYLSTIDNKPVGKFWNVTDGVFLLGIKKETKFINFIFGLEHA